MSSAAVIGTVLNLTLSSVSDRYRAHRFIYLLSLICTYLAIALLIVPIISNGLHGPLNPISPLSNDGTPTERPPLSSPDANELAFTTAPVEFDDLLAPDWNVDPMSSGTTTVETLKDATENSDRAEVTTSPHWVYIIGVCLTIGSLGIAINMNFSESFSANIGRCLGGDGEESYCSIRFFGALGWCLASMVLSQLDERSLNLPYLFVPWLLFTCLYGLNTFLVLVWPDKRPFSLAYETLPLSLEAPAMELGLTGVKRDKLISTSFGRLQFGNFRQQVGEPVFIGARRLSLDSFELASARPKLHRSSIATLGNSHVIEQFEFTPVVTQANGQHQLRRWSNKHSVNGPDESELDAGHFKYVTKIQSASGVDETELRELRNRCQREGSATRKSMNFKLYLKIIELIGRRNKNMPRFLVLYAVVGVATAMNWYFLFPYLDQLNPEKFRKLGPYVMISGYLSEMLFYYLSPRVPCKVRASIGLSMVLLVFAIRYMAYLTFSQWPESTFWPMEMVVVVELLQSLTIGWFDCILNESALDFALEAENCLPRLIELQLIDDLRPETVEMVKNSVKLSLVGVSACFFDGIGVATGALVGGWLIVRFDYSVLWLLSAAISLAVALTNLVLEWTLFKNYRAPGENLPEKAG